MTNCQELPKNPNELSSTIGYSFKDQELLFEALRHPSYVYEMDSQGISDNQRLEFLGDAVINLVVSHMLMESFPEIKEGDLSKCRASLVSENGLHSIAQKVKLGDYIFLGKGEELTNGRKKSSILSDAIEALIGAIYLDGGFDSALKVAASLFSPFMDEIDLNKSINDFKTELQEHAQEVFRLTPEYRLEKETGPDHDKTFYAAVYLGKKAMGRGNGKSKKEAEQKAAQEALAWVKK
jgi:ribonuclease-3